MNGSNSTAKALFVVACIALVAPGVSAQCVEGPYHVDALETPNFVIDFQNPDVCPIPADFFNPGSDPFFGVVQFVGEPIGPVFLPGFPDPLDFGSADTLILRTDDPFDRCDLPSPGVATVPIQIIALELRSVSPIVVTYNGGQDPELWDVRVTLDPNAPQAPGLLDATKEHCNGGTYNSQLPVCPRFVFTRIDDQFEVEYDVCPSCDPTGIPLQLNGPWVHEPPAPSDNSPVCTDFLAGVDDPDPTLSCDCPCIEAPYHIDPFVTLPNTESFDFGAPSNCPLPADFFGPGSDPFDGQVALQGEPLGPVDLPGIGVVPFGPADTLILRSDDPFDRCELPAGGSVEVPIEIIELNLVSSSPIVVTYNGGQDPEEWDLRMTVDPNAPSAGTLSATKTHCNGGTYDSILNVCPRFIFTRLDDGLEVILDHCSDCDPGGIERVSEDVPWSTFIPEDQKTNPVCSDFQAGFEDPAPTQDCDCNDNGVFDAGQNPCRPGNDCDRCGDNDGDSLVRFSDLILVLSNWDTAGPLGDTNCDGIVDFTDLLNVLSNWD